jgi:hypothetical protein
MPRDISPDRFILGKRIGVHFTFRGEESSFYKGIGSIEQERYLVREVHMFSSCIAALSRTALRLICATASFDFAVLIGFSQEWNTFIHCNLRSVQNPNGSNPPHNGICATIGTFPYPC